MESLYYHVWRKNGGYKPRKKHQTLAAARKEAERLSSLTPDAKFVILAAVCILGPVLEVEGDGSGKALPAIDAEVRT